MNKEQVKGVAKDVAGKVQEQAGEQVGSKEQQIKGASKQNSRKALMGVCDIKQAVKSINNTWSETTSPISAQLCRVWQPVS